MGTPSYAVKILESLINSHIEISSVFTQPDRPAGRKMKPTRPPVKEFILSKDIKTEIFQPNTLKEEGVISAIKSQKPDFIVVAAYGLMLPKEILSTAPCINLHASLLPKFRGASPIQQALLENEKITGVTAMLMDEGLDSGDILGYEVLKIDPKERAPALYERLANSAADLTPFVLENFDRIEPLKQNRVDASYCKKIKKEDGLVSFEDSAEIFNRFRAFDPWPGVFLKSGLKLKELDLIDETSPNQKGAILEIGSEWALIGCERGVLKISRVQPPSKREMDTASYLRGRRLKVGDTLA